MDTDKIKVFGARVKVDSTGKLAELERAEREKMKAKVEAIAAHGINCFVNRQLIYNYPESLLAEKGILVIEHADFEGVERLSLVTGGEIASTFDRPDLVNLGRCELIEEIIIGEDKVIRQTLVVSSFLMESRSSSNFLASPLVKHVPLSCAVPRTRWSMKLNAPCTTHSQFCRRQ